MRGARLSLAAAAAAALAAQVAAQETLRVRAGEHGGYSRIVIDAPVGVEFAWGVDGRRLRALVGDADISIDAAPARSQVAGLSRVTGLRVEGGVLELDMTCDCGARLQRLGDGRIVIDVAEGAPRPPAPSVDPAAAQALATRAVARPSPRPAPARPPQAASDPAPDPAPDAAPEAQVAAAPDADVDMADAASSDAAPRDLASIATALRAMIGAPPLETPEDAPTEIAEVAEPAPAVEPPADPMVEQAAAQPMVEPEPEGEPMPEAAAEVAEAQPEPEATPEATPEAARVQADARIEAARQALLEQLTRAADEGLVELSDRDAEDLARADAPADDDMLPEPQVIVRNAVDIARDRDPRLPPLDPDLPAHCLRDAVFAMDNWADERPFDEQLAERRRALLGEFDQPRRAAVIDHARTLVVFGFGLEARAALSAFLSDAERPVALAEIAHLVDGLAPPADGVLAKGADCPGDHGLWGSAAAAANGVFQPGVAEASELDSPLRRVPARVRPTIGRLVGEAAFEAGDIRLAEVMADIADAARSEDAARDTLLDVLIARLDANRGLHGRAEETLMRIGQRTSPAGVEAMIRLAEIRVDRGLAPPSGLARNMEAVAFSLETTALGRRLLAAAAMARAKGEGLPTALETLETLARRAGDARAASVAARDMLVAFEPDPRDLPGYAQAVLDHWHLVGDGPEGDAARIAVAERMADAGVENLAADLLAPAVARGDPAARVAAARAAVAAGDAAQALALLDGLDDPEAQRVRAEAHGALGAFEEAAAAARLSGDQELAASYAWRAGDWSAAGAGGSADRRILAAWATGADELPPDLADAVASEPALRSLAEAARPAQEPEDPTNLLQRAQGLLEAAQRRRAVVGDILTDG